MENPEETLNLKDHALVRGEERFGGEDCWKFPIHQLWDESDFSDDENGQPKLSGHLVKKLPWERSALTKVKKALDDAHIKA